MTVRASEESGMKNRGDPSPSEIKSVRAQGCQETGGGARFLVGLWNVLDFGET